MGSICLQWLPFLLRWLTKQLVLLNMICSIGFSRKYWGLGSLHKHHNIYNMRPKKNTCINMYSQGKERQQNHHVHPFSPHIHGLCWFPASPPLRRPDKWAPPSLGLWTSMTCAAESGIRGLQIETAQKSSPQKVVFLATMWGPPI